MRDPGAQNAKQITLEVRDGGGGSDHFPLVKVLQTLPFAKDYDFRHPGDVETVELRLFQEGRPIQVVGVQVPRTTPKDTPIRMHVVMHENYAITVEGTIGETPYRAGVRLPMERGMPSVEQADDLARRFEENLPGLPAGQRATIEARLKVARKALEEARLRGDVAQANHEYDELQSLVESLGKGETELRPPKADFDRLVEDCRELHAYYVRDGVPDGRPFDAEEIGRTIEEYRRGGERAYTNRDQRLYAEAVEKFRELHSYLVGLRRGASSAQPVMSTADRAESTLRNVVAAARQLKYLAQNLHDTAAEQEIARIQDQSDRLDQQLSVSPFHVLEEAAKLRVRLRQIQAGLVRTGEAAAGTLTGIPLLDI